MAGEGRRDEHDERSGDQGAAQDDEQAHAVADEQSFPSATVKLASPTADPVIPTKAAVAALEDQIIDGVPYARAGVMLTDLSPAGAAPQLPMFSTAHEEKRIGSLLGDVMDRFGTGAIGLGRAGMAEAPDWGMKRNAPSPRYTTEWAELSVVKAS